MATLIQAVATYRPRVGSVRVVELGELAQRLSRGSLVTASITQMILTDLCDEIHYFVRSGQAVRIPGIGIFRPEVKLDGTMRTTVRLDARMRRNLVSVHDYAGEIAGREHIGLDPAALKALWDAEHPDDPLVLGVPGAKRSRAMRALAEDDDSASANGDAPMAVQPARRQSGHRETGQRPA